MTQKEIILEDLKSHPGITSIRAIRDYGITRLSAIIKFLKNDGHPIQSRSVKVKTRNGYTYVSEYYL